MTSARYKAIFTPITLGYGVFAVLLIFSVHYYLERACYADIALQTMEIINTGKVAYQLDRFGAIFIQVFPLIASLLRLPLEYVLMSYSVALVLENLFFFWLLHRVLKQKEIALVLVLFNVLMVTETFYWATNEIKQGFSFSILFAGVIAALPVENFNGLKKGGVALLYLALLIITIFLHPLVVFAVAFVTGFMALHNNKIFSQTTLYAAAIVTAIIALKYLLLPVATYDTQQLSLRQNFITYFPHYYKLDSFAKFIRLCIKDWYLYGGMVIVVTAFYLYRKQWLKLGWLLLFTLGYLTIINVTHLHSQKPFIECYYQALAVFILFPFVLDLLPGFSMRYVLPALAVMVLLRINTIYHTHYKYTAYLDTLKKTLLLFDGKFIIPQHAFPRHADVMTWGSSYETVLLTAMESPGQCRSFVIIENFSKVEMNGDQNSIQTVFGTFPYSFFNPHYFRPAPGEYRILTEEDLRLLRIAAK